MGEDDNVNDRSLIESESDKHSEPPADERQEESPLEPDLIEYIPEKRRNELVRSLVLREEYSGPIAHPRIIAGYERFLPGSADRILTMAEEQQRHRFKMEEQHQKGAFQREKRAIDRGFILAIFLMVLSGVAIYLGSDLVGFGLIATSIVSLAGVFLYGHRSSRNELRNMREALDKPSTPPELPVKASNE
ncbi:MAG: DUF2335 domain-containing protein [Gammaproteobacteria bacterium]|nr:DUF2335 domain-containing protein [Gammaproteobacteria bacterium]